jgi:hypothetical protein
LVPAQNISIETGNIDESLLGFLQSLQANSKILPQIRLRPLPPTSSPIHYSLIFLSLDVTEPELLSGLLSKEINTLIIKLLIIQFFRPPFAFSLLGPHVLYRTLLSNILKIVLHEQKSFPKTHTNNKENKSETGSTWAPAPVCRRVLKNYHSSDCAADLLTWFPVSATSCS